jgi:hypothetical protein
LVNKTPEGRALFGVINRAPGRFCSYFQTRTERGLLAYLDEGPVRLSLRSANGVSFIKRAILIYKAGLDLVKISERNLPDKRRSPAAGRESRLRALH